MKAFILFLTMLSGIAFGQTVEVGGGSGGGVTTYHDASKLPAKAQDGATAVTLDSHAFYIYNLGSLSWVVQTASTGVVGPGVSVDSEVALFSGTGGGTVKRATGTGVAHLTSGVLSAAAVNLATEVTGNLALSHLPQAATSAAGYLSSTDWNTFNTKIGSIPWSTPNAIGNVTPASGNFTIDTANQFVSSQGTPLAGHGYIFDSDTGMSSPSDGVLDFWVNNVKQMELVGPTLQIRGVDYQFPTAQGALGETLVNNGSGVLSWSASVPWETPGTIGSTTPNTGTFTTLTAQGRIIGTESADFTTGGFLFSESGYDTGFTSPSDGVISVYANSAVAAQFQSVGISQIRGVDYSWPAGQAAAPNYVLTNDGNGALSWALPVAPTITGNPTSIAAYDVTTGNLGVAPNLSFDANHGNGLQYQNTFDPFTSGGGFITHSYNNVYNPSAATTGLNYGQMQYLVGLGTDDAGFSIDADGSGTFTQSNFYLDGAHKASTGDVTQMNISGNFGNGTDAMTGKRYRGIGIFDTFNNGVTVDDVNPFQVGYQFNAGTAVGNYSGINETSQFGGTVNNYNGITVGQGTQVHVLNNATVLQTDGDWQQVDGGFTAYQDNTHGGTVTGNVNHFVGGGNWTNVGGYTFIGDATNITGTQLNNYFVLNSGAHIATSHGYFGVNLTPTIDTLTGGNAFGVNISPTVTATGSESVYGLNINMNNAHSASGQIQAINATGDMQVNGKAQISVDHIPMVDGGGNPSPYHMIGGTFEAAASSTTANVDKFMFSPLMNVNLAAGATATSGPLSAGVNAEGFIMLNSLEAGSSLDNEGGSFNAFVGTSGSGTITHGFGYRSVLANFGSTITLTDYKAFQYDEPFGGWATTSWGLYMAPATAKNWISGSLKIGGTAGSTDQVTTSGVGLEVDTAAAFNSGIQLNTTTTKPTCDATKRGTLWVDDGSAGVTDTVYACLKSILDTYSWVSVVTGG